MHLLKINVLATCPNRDFVIDYYQNKVNKISYSDDCGVDLVFPEDVEFITNKVTKANLGIACEFVPGNHLSGAFDLVARSSLSATPLMLTNAIGVFDPQYRGPVFVAFRCFVDRDHPSTVNDFKYLVKQGARLVQIVAPDRMPIQVAVVDELTVTDRNDKGFGSTGVNV